MTIPDRSYQHFQADRVLSGDWVTIFPKRTKGYKRDGKVQPADADFLQSMVTNYTNRMELGLRQELVPVNVEHQKSDGKVGHYQDVRLSDPGVQAKFDLTAEGRRMLEEGRFSYFSVELYMEMNDRETGEKVGPVICGGAFTNYAFWGEETSLFAIDKVYREILQQKKTEESMKELEFTNEEVGALRKFLSWFSALGKVADGTPPATTPQIPTSDVELQSIRDRLVASEDVTNKLTQEKADLEASVKRMEDEASTRSKAALLVRATTDLEGLTGFGFEASEIVGHFATLLELDEGIYKAVYSMLSTASKLLDKKVDFKVPGGSGEGTPETPYLKFEKKVQAFAAANDLDANPKSDNYMETIRLFSISNEENAALYRLVSGL
jgi:hypothetical protein